MPTQAMFTTPQGKHRPRTKLRSSSTPTTFSLITKNLMKTFASEDAPTPPVLDNITCPDFSNTKFPDDFTAADKKKAIVQMSVNYAATIASESLRKSTPKFSFKDIETQHANDVKPIDELIKDNTDSFLTGLFQFRRVREQFRGWESATFISKYEATSTYDRSNSDDDDDMSDANKWTTSKIDLFKDFEQIDIDALKAWATKVWNSPTATLESQDGHSSTYARKVFSEFIFASLVPELQKAVQNAIPVARLWNDGPYVWATLIHRFFPSAVVLRTTLLDKMKSATLAEHKHDLSTYCATLLDMNAVVDTSSHVEELVNAFLTQVNTHPSDIVRNHFNTIGIKFFLNKGKQKPFATILEAADRLHTLTTSPALPFAATTTHSNKQDQNIAALAGILKGQTGSMKKIVAALSQLDNKVKQGVTKPGTNGRNKKDWQRTKNMPQPPWSTDAPSDPSEVKEFNGKPWFYCATCGRWSTTHSTNGMTHNEKTIPKHNGTSFKKKRDDQSSPSASASKKYKSDKPSPVNGIKSLKAELTNQNNSSVLDLIVQGAAGRQ
jgi:hypothetical protein